MYAVRSRANAGWGVGRVKKVETVSFIIFNNKSYK